MVFMASDHTRPFFTNAGFSPTDLSKTLVAMFLSRWIKHFNVRKVLSGTLGTLVTRPEANRHALAP